MLFANISAKNRVVGLNQTQKAIKNKTAKIVYIASDADAVITAPVVDLCKRNAVTYDRSLSMAEIGRACSIKVGCAVCAVID